MRYEPLTEFVGVGVQSWDFISVTRMMRQDCNIKPYELCLARYRTTSRDLAVLPRAHPDSRTFKTL